MTPPASPQPPERPALPVRVVAWEDVEKVGPLILKSDGSTALTVTLKSGEVFAVPGSWSPIHPLGAWTTNP